MKVRTVGRAGAGSGDFPSASQLAGYARLRHRDDLASLIAHPATEREQRARAVRDAIEKLRQLPLPAPMVTDTVDRWLPTRGADGGPPCQASEHAARARSRSSLPLTRP